MSDYFDRVLIKLKRQYKSDEVVNALSKKLSEKEIQIGILKDEIEYYKAELKTLDSKAMIEAKIEAKKSEYIQNKIKECKELKVKVEKLTVEKDKLLLKNYELSKK
jgi:hypothetical protein